MIKEIYQELFRNASLLGEGVLFYARDTPILGEYTQKLRTASLSTFDTSLVPSYGLVVIDPSMELSEPFLTSLVSSGKPIILPYSEMIKTLDCYVYDLYTGYTTIRGIKDCSSYLNFYVRFQEDNEMQRFLDKEYATDFSDLLRELMGSFYDIKSRLVYPFPYGGHSGCFILGESHLNWHTWPEEGRLDVNINSCTNKNPIPIIRKLLVEMFKLDKRLVYTDYKEVHVHFPNKVMCP